MLLLELLTRNNVVYKVISVCKKGFNPLNYLVVHYDHAGLYDGRSTGYNGRSIMAKLNPYCPG